MINLPMPVDPGLFYKFQGFHVLAFKPIDMGTILDDDPVDVDCALIIRKLRIHSEIVGLAFSSYYRIHNQGGMLWTAASKGYDLQNYTTVIRDSKIVIYNFKDAALAISPQVSPYVEAFFEEQ